MSEEDELKKEIEKRKKSKRKKRGPYRKSSLGGKQQKFE